MIKYIKPVRVASVIRNFAKKFGYVLENIGLESTGKRHRVYEIKTNMIYGCSAAKNSIIRYLFKEQLLYYGQIQM